MPRPGNKEQFPANGRKKRFMSSKLHSMSTSVLLRSILVLREELFLLREADFCYAKQFFATEEHYIALAEHFVTLFRQILLMRSTFLLRRSRSVLREDQNLLREADFCYAKQFFAMRSRFLLCVADFDPQEGISLQCLRARCAVTVATSARACGSNAVVLTAFSSWLVSLARLALKVPAIRKSFANAAMFRRA